MIRFVFLICCATSIFILSSFASPSSDEVADQCGLQLAQTEFVYSNRLKACADEGNPEALAWLGILYWSDIESEQTKFHQDGIPYTETRLEELGLAAMKSAASKGNLVAANELGLAYMEGTFGLDVDIQAALPLLEAADAQGDEFAPQNLAILYANGRGVPRSKERALEYLKRSADRGSVISLWTMGAYHLSKKTDADVETAEAYFLRAAILGGACARPSEVCEDFQPLFEDEQTLYAANKHVASMSIASC
ncbi:MAG: tetratricopeptide repeat protein [Pseudomonadota bacterium]